MKPELKNLLAYEYGRLDAIHGMGYCPPYFGFEKEYCAGFNQHHHRPVEGWTSSYRDPENWGWY